MTKDLHARVARLKAAALPAAHVVAPETRARFEALMAKLRESMPDDPYVVERQLSPCGKHYVMKWPPFGLLTSFEKIERFCERYDRDQLTDADRLIVAQLPDWADEMVRGIAQAYRTINGEGLTRPLPTDER